MSKEKKSKKGNKSKKGKKSNEVKELFLNIDEDPSFNGERREEVVQPIPANELLSVKKSIDSEPEKSIKHSNAGLKGVIVFLLLLLTPIMLHSMFNITFSTVLTGSMEPKFNPGDILITKQIQASAVRVGEIVVLKNPDTYTIYSHRIISVSPDKTNPNFLDFSTKGDANPVADAISVKVNRVAMVPLGVGRIPWVGRVIVDFTNHKGKVVGDVAIFLAFLLIVGLLFGNKGKKSKEKKK